MDDQIRKCQSEINAIEKEIAEKRFSYDCIQLNAALLEVNARLNLFLNIRKREEAKEAQLRSLLLAKRQAKLGKRSYTHAFNPENEESQLVEKEAHQDSDMECDDDQYGAGYTRAFDIPRTLTETAWLKEIEQIKEKGESKDIVLQGYPLSHFLKLTTPVEKGSSSRGTAVFETTALITNVQDSNDPDALLTVIFEELQKMAFSGKSRMPDLMNVQFYGEGMGQAFYIPMRSPTQNNTDAIKAQFLQLSQSETLTSIFNNELSVKYCGYWAPGGSQCAHDSCKHVVPCGNKSNNFCLARSICYGKYYCEKDGKNMDAYVLRNLEKDTVDLMRQSKLDMEKEAYFLPDATRLMEVIGKKFRLVIFNDIKQVILNTNYAEHVIFLQLKDNHFDFIPKPHLFLNVRKICYQCLKAVQPNYHARGCIKLCLKCMQAKFDGPCKSDGKVIECKDGCGFLFSSQKCFDAHKETSKIKKNSICSTRSKCKKCDKILNKRDKRPHHCTGETENEPLICENCNIVHDKANPFCFIQPKQPKVPQYIRYVYFDIESQIIAGKHVPILLCCYVYCTVCADNDADINGNTRPKECRCGVTSRFKAFNGYDGISPVDKFIDFIIRFNSKKPTKSIIIAHNFSRYDGHCILEVLYQRNYNVEIVAQGFKMFCLKIKLPGQTIEFKDSLNFISSPLKKLPEMFGFEGESTKLYFPHGANIPENLHKTLPCLPEPKDYWCDLMKVDDRKLFMEWYSLHKSSSFNLTNELEIYCKIDCVILLKACVAFRRIMIDVNGIDPFACCMTIAGYAFTVFRANVLQPNFLVNVCDAGYRKFERQSEAALKFFKVYEMEHNVKVQDSTWAEGEFKVPQTNYKIDGVIKNSSGRIIKALEYGSCYHHGHDCYPPDKLLIGGIPARVLYKQTLDRKKVIEGILKCPVELIWECEFKERLKRSSKLSKFFNSIELPPRIQLRDSALKGGRVECFRLYYKCKEGEEIRYLDIVSLYPFVIKHCQFPLSNPTVLTYESFEGQIWKQPGDNKFKGFILCKVLPPQDLDLPLLAYKSKNGNLVFCNCSTCADTQTPDCTHDINERSWIATYTHDEINESLKLGYTILKIYEVWNYERWSTPGGKDDLFGKYCNTFISLKCEASGYPCAESERENYIANYMKREGVQLNPSNMKFNPGKRAVAKLMANSLWGKFAQKSNLSEVKIAKSAAEFHKIINDVEHEVLDFLHINHNTDRIVVRKKEEFQSQSNKTCVPVAAFVTAHARLKLYSYLKQVKAKDRLYGDTDSLLYIKRMGAIPIHEDIFLGTMAREFESWKIIEFCSAGPKNYAILMINKDGVLKVVIKVRGFPMTYNASQLLTFEKMKEKVFQQFKLPRDTPQPIQVEYVTIVRNKKGDLRNVNITKDWKPVMKKGFVQEHFIVRPWGYKSV